MLNFVISVGWQALLVVEFEDALHEAKRLRQYDSVHGIQEAAFMALTVLCLPA
jgi:hypothetical protein